jgi:DNA-binding transcriptional LysR family regulator
MEIDQLRTFVAVLEHGSFSRAGRALRIGQSTVSFHIKALEEAVGARLCDRRGARVRSTAEGRVLQRYANRMLALRAEALERLRGEERGERGEVRVAASSVPAAHLLPTALARFLSARPQVAVRVSVSSSDDALDALAQERCDLAVVGARNADARFAWQAVGEDEIVLVGPPGSPRRLTSEALIGAPLVVRGAGSGTRAAVAELLALRAAAGGPPPLEIDDGLAVLKCVEASVGFAFLSRRAAADALAAGRLATVAVPDTPVRRRFWAAWLRRLTLSPAARALLRELQKNR